MPTFSLIVTCKGRLMHLRQTLPLFCALPDTEVILVDYGCPDGSGVWAAANFPAARVVRVLKLFMVGISVVWPVESSLSWHDGWLVATLDSRGVCPLKGWFPCAGIAWPLLCSFA